ncbi:MAG: MoaD/ThiS family protein [Chloroflexota bacterium]|nr:MoaD/ThiS family protein [Chloroflexota bacterium]
MDEPVMIAVSVRYHNMLRRRTGVEQETITLTKGTSLRAALEHLADRHASRLREMLFASDGSIVSHLVIFRNRKLVSQDQHHLVLVDGDELMLFPAIAGG